MNRYTNSAYAFFILCTLLAGCAQAKPVAVAQPVATPQTEPIVAPVANDPAPEVAVPAPKTPAQKAYVPSPDKKIEQLKEWDKNLLFLQTNFTQVTSYDGVEISRSKGVLFYNKDKNLLRLDTTDSDGALIQSAVTNKKDLLILDDKNHLIMKMPWAEWQQNQPNQALFDFGNYTALLNRHNIRAIRPNYFALTPKSGETYTLYLTLSAQDAFPTALRLEADGVTTQADLLNTQKNQPLPENTFGGAFK